MEPALRLRGVTKTFGATRAVDHLDLDVPRGATYGFIGPSGAGKTTCIRMIMSILFPDTGELAVLGRKSALPIPNTQSWRSGAGGWELR